MPKNLYHVNRQEINGFTIVELLIVVVVIAILAAVTIVSFTGISQRARETSTKSDLTSYSKKLEAEKITSGGFTSAGLTNYLAIDTQDSTISFRYGDTNSFCMNGNSKSNPSQAFYVSSANGISATLPGSCPPSTNTASLRCVAGEVVLTVQQTNYTAETLRVVTTTLYGNNTNPSLAAGATTASAYSARVVSAPAGVASISLSSNSGSGFSMTHFIRYEALSC